MENTARLNLRISGRHLATLCFLLAMLSLIDGAMQQVQMIATGGYVPIPPVAAKAGLLVVLGIAVIWQRKWQAPRTITFLWLLTIGYLAADALFLLTHLNISIADVAIGYNSYYAYLLIAPVMLNLQNEISERQAITTILIVFALCFLVGSLQFITQRPLLYTESLDGSFFALSWTSKDDGLRAFSLFSSGLSYGGFCCLAGAIGTGLFFCSRHRGSGIMVFLLAAVGCYTTMTRNCYLQFAFAAMCAVMVAFTKLRRFVRYLPILFLLVSVAIALRATSADSSADSAITSNVSVLIRAAEWQYYLSLYWTAPLVEKLFGLGIIQNANAASDALIAVDNQYLSVLMNVGLVGLFVIGWLHWKMWLRVYCKAMEEPTAFRIACAAFWSTFLSVYFYNLSITSFCLVFMLAVMAEAGRRKLDARLSNGLAAKFA